MKGVIFNLLEELVIRTHGEDAWDDLLDSAGLAGSYTSLGSYSDQDMWKLVNTAASSQGTTPAEVLRWFGREAMPILAERYPSFFENHTTTRTFILSLNSIIHPEVRKIYPGADAPNFDFDDGKNGSLLVGYRSPRKLCALAQGFIEGAAACFGETVNFQHTKCMYNGDEKCLFELSFA